MTKLHHIAITLAASAGVLASGAQARQSPAQFVPPSAKLDLSHVSIDTAVAGAAVASDGRVYMWYKDGFVTAGSPKNPDDSVSPYAYTLPPGKSPANIVAMAINSIDRVYTWYDDHTRSVGTSADLDAYQAPTPYELPQKSRSAKYSPGEIVGVTISAADEVRAYYSNGKSSTGTSLHLGKTGNHIVYQTAGGRSPKQILAMAATKGNLPTTIAWHSDGYYSVGAQINLGASGQFPYAQHLTIYSFKKLPAMSEPGASTFMGPGPVEVVRGDLNAVHEPVLAPGHLNVAVARSTLSIFRKTGEKIFHYGAGDLFDKFLDGTTDPVRDLNSFNNMGDCNAYPQTKSGHAFCVFQAYDTRAAYDKNGDRFVFLANARNHVWQGANLEDAPNGECSVWRNPADEKVFSHNYCDKARRHLLIAVSVSEDPADGFHLYAIKEDNYRDWPLLAVNNNQLIVGHAGGENPGGYPAIVFNLEDMRNGVKRPRYFKLTADVLDGATNIRFPREQEGAVMTVGIGSYGHVFGFSKFWNGYALPPIRKSAATIPWSINYTLRNGTLHVGKSGNVSSSGEKQSLFYGRYPVSISFAAIDVKTSTAEGAYPYQEITLPAHDYATMNCARLAVTKQGDEVIAFAGARLASARGAKLVYDAAFVARPSFNGGYVGGFSAPQAYKAGSDLDPNSWSSADDVTVSPSMCQQQGAAASDPFEPHRVWMLHNYGLTNGAVKGALGWTDVK